MDAQHAAAEGGGACALSASAAKRPRLDQSAEDTYFNGYVSAEVHHKMLTDKVRMQAYADAVDKNRHLFEGKCVMDVGAGNGILSLLAARAGAKRVLAVEASGMAFVCREIVAENGLSDVITVLHSKVEDLEGLPDGIDKVDVIISEWMGLLLVQEAVLDSVISARDRFLSADGSLFPSHARIYACPASSDSSLSDWDSICGFSFGPLKKLAKDALLASSPVRCTLKEGDLAAKPALFKYFDLKTIAVDQVKSMHSKLTFNIDKPFDSIAIWFDVRFAYGERSRVSGSGEDTLVLSTSPCEPETHWEQAVVMLPQTVSVAKGTMLPITCTIEQSTNHRQYVVELSIEAPITISKKPA